MATRPKTTLQMKLDRRQFITLTSGLFSTSVFTVASASSLKTPVFLSAASDGDDNHWVIGFSQSDKASTELFRHSLPGRAHHIAVHEGLGIYLVIARRPGKYLWVGDLESGEPLAEITLPADRHLYGHGVFSADGNYFYAPENAWQMINGDSGRVVVWEVKRADRKTPRFSMTRVKDFPSYGTGPHELLITSDQRTLVLANGGIRTHPERGRKKLNIESMQPSLAYINAISGDLEEQHLLDGQYHKASIRHMDQNQSGLIVVGMQYEGEPFDRVPLLVMHQQGEPLRELWAPEPQQGQMTQYVGSVRFDNSGNYFAASCPRGNMITFWEAKSGDFLRSVRSRDGCGLCAIENGFLFTAGTGRITYYDVRQDSMTSLDSANSGKVFWDNHLSVFAS